MRLTNSMKQSPLRKLIVAQLFSIFPAFYGIRSFITTPTKARHWILSWASSIQITPPHTMSLRSILMLSYCLRLSLQSGLFISCYPT